MDWREWQPGLDNNHLTLREVYETLPGFTESQIPLMTRLLENPTSPVAFVGAIPLLEHDYIHILLGRGLLNHDEAFVIGFTMGTSKSYRPFRNWLFKTLTKFYPRESRFSPIDCLYFDLGYQYGMRPDIMPEIYKYTFDERKTLSELRKSVGINIDDLKVILKVQEVLTGKK